jgi:hypothetical protein
MGLQAIEAVPKDGSPVFLVDKDTGDMTSTHWAVVQRLFQREGTSIAFSPTLLRVVVRASCLYAGRDLRCARAPIVARAESPVIL